MSCSTSGLTLAGLAVADLRTLSQQISRRFDAVLSCDNALPHLIEDAELAAAAQNLHDVLRPGGLLIATIRDYDTAEPRPGEAVPTPVRVLGEGPARRLVFQVWTWAADGRSYSAPSTRRLTFPLPRPLSARAEVSVAAI